MSFLLLSVRACELVIYWKVIGSTPVRSKSSFLANCICFMIVLCLDPGPCFYKAKDSLCSTNFVMLLSLVYGVPN